MQIRNIKKAFGLLVADFVIIIGIFVLQFRTDSSIIEKIRNLQVTLITADTDNNNYSIKNKLQISYNGLNFYVDEQSPAQIKYKNSQELEAVNLTNWTKSENGFSFDFSNNIKFQVELSDDEENPAFYANAILPGNVEALYMPYKYGSNVKVQKTEGNKIILAGKKLLWEISVPNLHNNMIAFTKTNPNLAYYIHDETQKFSFDMITELASADSALFEEIRSSIKSNFISAFKANTIETNLTEQIVVSYIAAQAENGNYVAAIDDIPQNIKKSKIRTYLSTPYLNSLSDMNEILETYIQSTDTQLQKALNSGSLDIFTIKNISNFLYVNPNKEAVIQLLKNAGSAMVENATIAQITGLIQAFIDFSKIDSEYAALIQPCISDCIDKIESACKIEGSNLSISENDTFISVIQAVETGCAVMRYGQLIGNETLVKAGYVFINTNLSRNSSFDLRTLANLYSILAYDNWYYPHFEIIPTEDNNFMWAWTCAENISYTKDEEGAVTLGVKFPETYTHYLIIKKVPRFVSIYIYDIAFRTDSRFETYNSSGYVYKTPTETLLLKSRQKSDVENIRFEYKARQVQKPVITEEPDTEDSDEAEETETSDVSTEY